MKKSNSNLKTKVVCPNCGAEFVTPETTHLSVGIVVGADSNLGVIYPETTGNFSNPQPKPSSQMKAEEKIEALRKAGVNVDNLFSMKGVTGQETVARLENGVLQIVPEDDPLFAMIVANGAVPNRQLFRRWVMSQMFHMLNYRSWNGKKTGFVAALEAKGYKYQWKMLQEEFKIQAKLFVADKENFELRNRWFNNKVLEVICVDYVAKLDKYIRTLKIKHCKGVPYKQIAGRNLYLAEIQEMLNRLDVLRVNIGCTASDPAKLLHLLNRFIGIMKNIWYTNDAPMSPEFKDAYKGAGAYFTMKNMILFHKASFKQGCIKFGKDKSLKHLEDKAIEYSASYEGWRLFGVMKKLIADSGINIEKKMAEWRK